MRFLVILLLHLTVVLSAAPAFHWVASGGGAKAVGNAVNETVVFAFMALFVINVVVTAIGIRLTTG